MISLQKEVFGKSLSAWCADVPALYSVMRKEEVLWQNGEKKPFSEAMASAPLSESDVRDAAMRLARFQSYFKRAFPETAEKNGIIESPLRRASAFGRGIEEKYGISFNGELLIKLDSHLPISSSIKARGGIYEVLCIAERIAMAECGLSERDDYAVLADEKYKAVFRRHEIAVGSTGNLGLSIGIMSAALGFRVTVHMSSDAREWKKRMLREKGVTVVEYEEDYSVAVARGREAAKGDPFCHFIDDENSKTLFLGYAVAALRLKRQFDEMGIEITKEDPLYVYLPCGVGGGPGGVAFGLKTQFADLVHPYFAEPTDSPCMLLGMATGLHNEVSVADFGLENRTIADGLAVGRPSGFVGKLMTPFLEGCYSVSDERMSALLKLISDTEGIRLEPSALAGAFGPVMLSRKLGGLPRGYHLIWATGGSMVPPEEWEKYYRDGEAVYDAF